MYDDRHVFDAELVENVIAKLSCGKAASIDGITSEHLQYSHHILSGVQAKLLNFMIKLGHIPEWFGKS